MKNRGALQIIAGASCFGLIPVFVSGCDGLSPWQIVFGRALAAVVFSAVFIKTGGGSLRPEKNLLGHYFTWSFFLAAAMICYVLSIRYAGMTVAGSLLGLQPLGVMLCVRVFFGERAGKPMLAAGITALAGVVLLSMGETGNAKGWTGIVFGLLTALLLGLNFTYHLRFLPGSEAGRLVYLQNLFQLPLLIPFLFLESGTITGAGLMNLAAMGLVCTFLAYYLIYKGSQLVSKHLIGLLQVVENIIPVILGVTCFNETMNGWKYAGVLLILAGLLLPRQDKAAQTAA